MVQWLKTLATFPEDWEFSSQHPRLPGVSKPPIIQLHGIRCLRLAWATPHTPPTRHMHNLKNINKLKNMYQMLL